MIISETEAQPLAADAGAWYNSTMKTQRPPFLPSIRQTLNLLLAGTGVALSWLFKRPVVPASPVMLMVEPTTACQLECPHCPTGRGDLTRPAANLRFEQFRQLWDSIHPAPLLLQLWNQGEPLVNRETPAMIRHAAGSGAWVRMATNGELLADDRLAGEIVASGLAGLILSLDGTTPESHVSYRVGGDFAKVERGVKNVLERREGHRPAHPVVVWQYLLFRHNLGEIREARRLARKWGVDRLVFKKAQLEELSLEEGLRWLPEDPALRRYDRMGDKWVLRRGERFFCKRIFSSAVVQADGEVVPCCFDKDGEFAVGNVFETPFPEIWRGDQFQAFRRRWIEGDRPAMCANCTEGLRRLYAKP